MSDPRADQPADQDVRERIVNDLNTSFFLEAGAGSGKTSVIVARVVNLVRHGRSLREIVAITFTEKAAAELRERIRAELGQAGLKHALRDVDAAPIQTIHAFAAQMLRERALDAELDPDVLVLDQLQADLRFAQSWRTWLWSDASPQSELQRALELGLNLRELQYAAEQLSRHRDLNGADAESEQAEEASDEQRARNDVLARLMPSLRDFVQRDADQRRRDGVLTYDDLLLEARDLLVRSSAARRALRERWRAILIDEFQDTDPLQAQIALLLAAESETDDWTEAQPGPGRLVLAGDPKQSIYRFRRADIDIYEQVRELFASATETADVVGLTVNFRARPQLSRWQNRALAGVVKSDTEFPRAQARWTPSVAHRSSPRVAEPAVAVISSQREFDRVGEARQAEASVIANLIAHMRDGASALGQLDSVDGDQGVRPPEYRDIAILVRTRAGADLYTAALDVVGIPYHFDSGQGFYRQLEIREVAQLLRALDDPTDDVSAVAVLKSRLVAASDDELAELRAALGSGPIALRADLIPDAYDGRLRDPILALAALRDDVRSLSLPELVDHVIRASGLMLAQGVGVRPEIMRQRQASLRMLVQRAAQFSEHSDSLRPFVRWLSQRGVRNLPESESPTTEADDDAVRVLTIHQAKGLEFPIVILPKLQDQPGRGADVVVDRQRDRLEFQLGDERAPFRTAGYQRALRRERVYADAEARRMLYVAATRARDWLLLTSFPAESMSRGESFHTYLEEAVPHWLTRDADRDAQVLHPRAFDAAAPSRPQLRQVSVEELDDLRERWRERRRESLRRGVRAIETRTPSAHVEAKPSESSALDRDLAGDEPSFDPLDFGQAVHEALEAADFSDLERTQRRAVRICEVRHAPTEEVLAHVERALHSDLLRRASQAAALHRELPLTTIANVDEQTTITEGVADLLFLDQSGWVLVDYKSDASIPSERLVAYQRQLRLYAAMLAAAGIEVAEAHLLLTATGESINAALDSDAAS